MNLTERKQQVVVVQEVRYRIIARDDHVELPPMVGVGLPHVADRQIDRGAAAMCLGLGPCDRPCGLVGRGDDEAALRQPDRLRADPARNIEDGLGSGPPAIPNDPGELPGLALDAFIPVWED